MTDTLSRLDQFLHQLPSKQRPPVTQWQPTHSGTIDIRIDAKGDWYHEGDLIRRQPLVNLFASILRCDDDGYWLVTPVEKQRIQVEDAPLFVDQMRHEGDGQAQRILLGTRTSDWVGLDGDHRFWVESPDEEPAPYVMVRDRLHARIGRNVFYQLAELAEIHRIDGVSYLGVWSHGQFFPLGPAD